MKNTKTKHIASFFFLLCGLIVFSGSVACAKISFTKIGNTEEIQNLFRQAGYNDYIQSSVHTYPQIYIENFPAAFGNNLKTEERKKLFFMALMPLVLKINEDLGNQAKIISYLRYKFSRDELDADDEKIIESFAKKYDISTPFQGYRRTSVLLKRLQTNVDVIPPSLLLSVAAINTNWGQAKFLPLSNALYRELNWYSNEGLKPEDEKEDDSYRIKIYPSLYAAMEDYALKLNSNVDYEDFRQMRQTLQNKGQPLSGKFLAPYLIFASDLPNFAGLLDYTITFYHLDKIDRLTLFKTP